MIKVLICCLGPKQSTLMSATFLPPSWIQRSPAFIQDKMSGGASLVLKYISQVQIPEV